MTLRTKLLAAQLPLWCALLLVGVLALYSNASLSKRAEDILNENYRSVQAVRDMTESLERLNDLAQASLVVGEPVQVSQAARLRERFESSLGTQESTVLESGEHEATGELKRAWSDYAQRFKSLVDEHPGRVDQAQFESSLMPAFGTLKRSMDEIVDINQLAMEHKTLQGRREARDFQAFTAAVSLAAMIAGLVLTFYLTSNLLRPLSVLGLALERIGGGDFEAMVRLQGRDEITRLAESVNQMSSQLLRHRQKSLSALLLAQQASQATLNSLADPVLVLDLEGRLVNLNQAAEAIMAQPPALGTPVWDHLEMELAQRLRHLWRQVLEGRGPVKPQGFGEAIGLATGEGSRRFLLPRAAPVREPGGGLIGVTLFLQEVTRLRRFDQIKTDLVATVAHEFRTPLTSLRMAVYLCLEGTAGPLSAKQTELLEAARQDCERVQTMVDDLLDLSRLGEGGLGLRRRPLSVEEIMKDALGAHAKLAARQEVDLYLEPDPPPALVLGDPERVAIVFSNLIINALRHTPAGGRVGLMAQEQPGAVRFSVSDTGPGIPAERLPGIFERFQGAGDKPDGASGLGLFIAREAVTSHGGQIGADSQPGQGSRFWFTLPKA